MQIHFFILKCLIQKHPTSQVPKYVLIFIAALTNYDKFCCLNQHHLSHNCCRSEVQAQKSRLSQFLCLESHKAEIEVSVRWHSFPEGLGKNQIFQTHSGCWKNSFPWGCRAEIPEIPFPWCLFWLLTAVCLTLHQQEQEELFPSHIHLTLQGSLTYSTAFLWLILLSPAFKSWWDYSELTWTI